MIDAVVIGSGPNGLAAAVALARAGRSVRVYEAEPTIGGGIRSAALTEPGYVHDVCAAVLALVAASPFLKTLPLDAHGLTLIHPGAPFAHPLGDGTAVVVERSVDATADGLGRDDGRAYRRLIVPLVENFDVLMDGLLGPLLSLRQPIRHPIAMVRLGLRAIRSARGLATGMFRDERTRALFAGVAAHSMVRLDQSATSGYALGLIMAAHAVGWPVARGGSQHLADALVSYLRSLGGEVVAGERVSSLGQLPPSRAVLCDITPRQFLAIAGDRVPSGYAAGSSGTGTGRACSRRTGPSTRRCPGARRRAGGRVPCTWAAHSRTSPPVNDRRRAAACRIRRTSSSSSRRSAIRRARRPAATRCGRTCHVPHGSTADMTGAIEAQIERFAPGFRDTVVARHTMGPADLERHNANLVGGDISGGAADLAQLVARPVLSLNPYKTPVPGVYLCSSSTPPGVGVHGMCGYHAARKLMASSILNLES